MKSRDAAADWTKLLTAVFLLLMFSLCFLQPSMPVAGQEIQLTDLVFLVLASCWFVLFLLGKMEIRWHRFYWFLVLFLLIIGISVAVSANTAKSAIKYLSEFYLAGLVFLTFNIVRTEKTFRKVILCWLIATLVACLIGTVSIFLFYIHPESLLLDYTQNHYGAVPVGNYPRINSTFLSASQFCNYLSVSLVFLLIARKNRWINFPSFAILFTLVLLNCIFTISSGIGAIPLILGVWFWFLHRDQFRKSARLALIFGAFVPILFFFLNFIALQKYPSAPFEMSVPLTGSIIYPSARFLVWRESLQTFAENPLFGVGIGQNSCAVVFQNSEGTNSLLTDAHNTYLSIASQTGIFGLAALVLGIFLLFKEVFPIQRGQNELSSINFGLGLAFISAFVYQGLLGSFEDTRYLWVLIGLILSFGNSVMIELRDKWT